MQSPSTADPTGRRSKERSVEAEREVGNRGRERSRRGKSRIEELVATVLCGFFREEGDSGGGGRQAERSVGAARKSEIERLVTAVSRKFF
ncbi:unnamed protein product [Linum trigynum]|uniref:Uncharacterized protein n=1 Tax=Linum trigynum TaxID=586398 RepID=A0AAV2GKF9_9ROSI